MDDNGTRLALRVTSEVVRPDCQTFVMEESAGMHATTTTPSDAFVSSSVGSSRISFPRIA